MMVCVKSGLKSEETRQGESLQGFLKDIELDLYNF